MLVVKLIFVDGKGKYCRYKKLEQKDWRLKIKIKNRKSLNPLFNEMSY